MCRRILLGALSGAPLDKRLAERVVDSVLPAFAAPPRRRPSRKNH